MNCASAHEWMEQFLDQELDATRAALLEEHMVSCRMCSETLAQQRRLQSDIRSQAPYYSAPAGLDRSVRDALRQASVSESPVRGGWRGWQWAAIATSVLLVASLGWNITLLRTRTADRNVLAQEILSSHIRSLIGTHLLDVPSSDQHTVKPWFNGKLDFSPEVKDLALQGFPLLGGRIEYLAGRPVAALVYGRRQHVINLFVWPSGAGDGESSLTRNGYNVIHWSDEHMTYWAVSDIPSQELEDFKLQLAK
jgi:anti-sigma factor RsiW